MKLTNHIIALFTGIGMILLDGCSTEENRDLFPDESIVPVHLAISGNSNYTRAPGDAALSVNRILILPFRKTNEALTDDPANFVPEYSSARQLNVSSFPAVATMLNLSATSTYQLVIIGYNQNDYDFANQNSATRKFSILSTVTPATLANLYLQPTNTPVVPELFSCTGTGYLKNALVGQKFKPSQVDNVKGTLTRLVSALSLQVNNVPGYVNAMTLAAEQLVTGTRITDAAPLTWQTAGDSGIKTLGTKMPVSGSVSFNLYMLPTTTTRNTLLYLDVAYGTGFKERYTVKIPDQTGVVSGNRITFDSNHWVKITGDYSSINLGFTLSGNINLDDNAWDGIQ